MERHCILTKELVQGAIVKMQMDQTGIQEGRV